jgi:hypothetical protein
MHTCHQGYLQNTASHTSLTNKLDYCRTPEGYHAYLGYVLGGAATRPKHKSLLPALWTLKNNGYILALVGTMGLLGYGTQASSP